MLKACGHTSSEGSRKSEKPVSSRKGGPTRYTLALPSSALASQAPSRDTPATGLCGFTSRTGVLALRSCNAEAHAKSQHECSAWP